MIINTFDYESDFVARSYYAITDNTKIEKESDCKETWVSAYGDSSPGIKKFAYATDEEIACFFERLKKIKYQDYLFYFKSNITPDYIKQRYHSYLTGLETWETHNNR